MPTFLSSHAGTAGGLRGMPGPLGSPRLLRLLIGLALDRDTAARVRAELVGDPDSGGLRETVVLADIVQAARLSAPAARRLEAILARQVRAEAKRFEGRPLSELAGLWAREGHTWRSSALAAFLWSVTRRHDPVFRKLAERVVEEIEVLAIRALAEP